MTENKTNTITLREREHILHEKLVEQTHQLQLTRERLTAYETAIQMTMAQLQEVR
ncbi:MAG: hypothetical protein H6660_10710, partial [Ardenticatenaceae bacterium]|nr:hypothetical protein [Ardenticatenaceae bacterium]